MKLLKTILVAILVLGASGCTKHLCNERKLKRTYMEMPDDAFQQIRAINPKLNPRGMATYYLEHKDSLELERVKGW